LVARSNSFLLEERQAFLQHAMEMALEEARSSLEHGDVPVGAVVYMGAQPIAKRHNEKELTNDPTAHAELLAIRDAAHAVGSWHLDGAWLISTLEPCPMCAGALLASRVELLAFGAFDPKAGACGSLYNLCVDPRFNHELEVVSGVLVDQCSSLLSKFFQARRDTR